MPSTREGLERVSGEAQKQYNRYTQAYWKGYVDDCRDIHTSAAPNSVDEDLAVAGTLWRAEHNLGKQMLSDFHMRTPLFQRLKSLIRKFCRSAESLMSSLRTSKREWAILNSGKQ